MGKNRRAARRARRKARKVSRKANRANKRAVRKEKRIERKEKRIERRETRKDERAARIQNRKAARKDKNVLGKIVGAIGGGLEESVLSSKKYIGDNVKNLKESGLGEWVDNRFEAKFRLLKIRYWNRNKMNDNRFPESELSEVMNRPNAAICFSGGGCRSAVSSFGQMRALVELGLESKIRYTTSNSGGSWFAIPYTFLPKSIRDVDFFGKYLPLEDISSIAQLRSNAQKSRYTLALSRPHLWRKIFGGAFLDIVTNNKAKDENWSRAVGSSILAPMKLYDAQRGVGVHRFFTWSRKTMNAIFKHNKFLEGSDFHFVEKSRPYNITVGMISRQGAVVSGGSIGNKLRDMAQLEMSPLYSGVYTEHSNIGCGYIESFGMDSAYKKEFGALKAVRLGGVHNRFTLSDVMGISGSALAIFDRVANKTMTPQTKYWSLNSASALKSEVFNTMDGGYLDNFALMPMLKRKVKKIVVCINAGQGIVNDGKFSKAVKHLFGDAKDFNDVTLLSHTKNHVFENNNNELNNLRNGLIDNNNITEVSFFQGKYKVLRNDNYGIMPYEVEILWYFLDKSKSEAAVVNRTLAKLDGELIGNRTKKEIRKEFPNASTDRLNMSEEEVALLANYTHWCFIKTADVLKDFLE